MVSVLGVSAARASSLARLTAGPAAGQTVVAGDTTTLRFTVEGDVEEMELLLSLDGGRTFPLRVSREMSEGTHQIDWKAPNLPTRRARLALRAGTEEEGEVIRDVSPEFTILASGNEPLEEIRDFRGELRAGEALREMPLPSPLEAPALAGSGDSIRALPRDLDLDRTSVAAAAAAPPENENDGVRPARPARVSRPAFPRAPRSLPRRE